MRHYHIKITVDVPYPKEFTFQERAYTESAAVGRALRKLRRMIPRKRITNWRIDAIKTIVVAKPNPKQLKIV